MFNNLMLKNMLKAATLLKEYKDQLVAFDGMFEWQRGNDNRLEDIRYAVDGKQHKDQGSEGTN